MKNRITKILPEYAFLPVLLVLAINLAVYYGTRLINSGMYHHDISVYIDSVIPFLPVFIIPYVTAYIQWLLGYILCGRESKEFCCKYMTSEITAKLITAVIFIVFPTFFVRPEIHGGGLVNRLTEFIFSADASDNLFPSIHCLESWFCVRTAFKMNNLGRYKKPYRIISALMTALVFASVLLVKQHVVLDIIGGVAVFELGLLITNLARTDRILNRLVSQFNRKE